jgi:ubiquinone/menaquinone biosynthesis C-methylase UbiE
MDRIEAEARRVFGARAARYTTSKAHTDPVVLARLVELAAPRADWRALDIATGSGHTAFALAPHLRMVVGTDLTPEMLREAARLRAERGCANVAFALADVRRLPFRAGAFQLLACRRAAHHFSDIRQALGEMRRVLRAGGRVVIDDRSVPEDDFVDACMNRLDTYHDPSHVRQYRPGEWRAMLEAAGFRVDALEVYTRHRPLTALTTDVSPENVQGIHALLARLGPAERTALDHRDVDGQPYLTHWYVMLAATRG